CHRARSAISGAACFLPTLAQNERSSAVLIQFSRGNSRSGQTTLELDGQPWDTVLHSEVPPLVLQVLDWLQSSDLWLGALPRLIHRRNIGQAHRLPALGHQETGIRIWYPSHIQ